jgi:hypothetical protein
VNPINPGLNFIRKAGITISAPARHDAMEIIARYPKNLIDVNPEKIRAEKPAITLRALIIILRPIVLIAISVALEYDIPELICRLKHQMY